MLTQCRPELIERTYESLAGAHRACVHFYNSVSELQRRVVFGLDKAGIVDIAVKAAEQCKQLEPDLTNNGTILRYEYSPENFTGTEPNFAAEICEAVMDVIAPTPENPMILNLPATVEMYSPNVYADVIEWFGRTIRNREQRHHQPCIHTTTAARRSRRPSWAVLGPGPTGSRARCSATASARATWTW